MRLRNLLILGTATAVTWVLWGPSAGIPVAIMAALGLWAEHWPWPGVMYQPNGHPAPRSRRPGDHGPRTLHRFAVQGCTDCALANPPPCDEHGARELARMPRHHPEYIICGAWPPELGGITERLNDEQSLAEGDAAEQEARRTANEGTN